MSEDTKKLKDLNKDLDRGLQRISISERKYDVWFLITKGRYNQTEIGERLGVSRQAIHPHVNALEILGLIEPYDPNANPKFYRATDIIPIVSKLSTPIVSRSAKKTQRTLCNSPILVRDLSSGKIKGWKSSRKIGIVRDYNTIVSEKGKRIPMIRAHSLSYICIVLREPSKERPVPWIKSKEGLKGMEQFVYRHTFDNKKSTWIQPALFNLKKIEVTFVRKITKNTDELVIYMPERYLLEYELDEAKKILTKYVWQAWKWFQSHFKAHLAFPIEYRPMEFAHELFDPRLRQWVQDKGMAKVQTKRGQVMIDESKIGIPEKEYSTVEQVKTDLHSVDKILNLEEKVSTILDIMTETVNTVNELAESQKITQENLQDIMGFRQKMEKRLEDENNNMFS